MNKIRICIIDDEFLAVQEMKLLLTAYSDVEVCGTANSVDSAIDLINSTNPDIIFLDIQLRDLNAFSILKHLKKDPHIVFVTAYNEFAIKAFDINALDYLSKPVHPKRLSETFERYKSITKSSTEAFIKYRYTDKIVIHEKNEFVMIKISDILYIEADGDYSRIFLSNKSAKLLLKSLSKWENLLPTDSFIRIHRSTIINLEYVDRIEKSFNNTCEVYLKGANQRLRMSQRYTSKFLARYKA